jgi:protein-S-isoprenylcysteine O-methyltransferase Ste14
MPARGSSRSPETGRVGRGRSFTRSARGEAPIVELFFVLGAILVVVGFLYSVARSWPSLDPLALATLVGIGLLLVVVCERLRTMVHELRALTALMRTAVEESKREPPG